MMHSNLVLLLGCCCVVTGLPAARLDSVVHSCGRNLADILELACRDRGGLQGPDTVGVGFRGRTSEGVVDKCCSRPCSWRTIISYCVNSTIVEQPDVEENDESLGTSLENLIFSPYSAPKRRSKKAGCRCSCQKRVRKPDRNRLPNNLNVGTVSPDLARPPVIVRNL
ncbi:insulin-like growth factor II [Cloeon dipterum]|uniref:Insulin-like domain-containing protein n=1 Tax=Cloeon dipterum TaxID=197152 RepID=A0A8S1CMM6_9INSE|nr:Hypothetical predicted protein [Cloeon dipterum]